MKKVMIIPLVATGMLLGCQDQNHQQQDQTAAIQQQLSWIGSYEGTTPCMGCLSRCDECPGMAVRLELREDLSYS